MIRKISLTALALGCATLASAAVTVPMLYEESLARQEEQRIIAHPIAGIENHFWFDYRVNVVEAKKELNNDLGGVSDSEDLRDAWDEYRHELAHDRAHYVKEMAERGYRYGIVTVGE